MEHIYIYIYIKVWECWKSDFIQWVSLPYASAHRPSNDHTVIETLVSINVQVSSILELIYYTYNYIQIQSPFSEKIPWKKGIKHDLVMVAAVCVVWIWRTEMQARRVGHDTAVNWMCLCSVTHPIHCSINRYIYSECS